MSGFLTETTTAQLHFFDRSFSFLHWENDVIFIGILYTIFGFLRMLFVLCIINGFNKWIKSVILAGLEGKICKIYRSLCGYVMVDKT